MDHVKIIELLQQLTWIMIKKIEIWDVDVLNKASYDNYTSSKDFEDLANEIDF